MRRHRTQADVGIKRDEKKLFDTMLGSSGGLSHGRMIWRTKIDLTRSFYLI